MAARRRPRTAPACSATCPARARNAQRRGELRPVDRTPEAARGTAVAGDASPTPPSSRAPKQKPDPTPMTPAKPTQHASNNAAPHTQPKAKPKTHHQPTKED